MSREHSNPRFVAVILQRIVDEYRKAGADVISLADLEEAIRTWGAKSGDNDRH